jgi:RNA polymerase-binding protein DksA
VTKIELDDFWDVLKNRRVELENHSHRREALAFDASSDELDRIQVGQERDLAIGNLDRDAKLLGEIRSALDRIRAGTFGLCPDCDGNISAKRLGAVPWTALCIVCQEATDRTIGASWPVFRAA